MDECIEEDYFMLKLNSRDIKIDKHNMNRVRKCSKFFDIISFVIFVNLNKAKDGGTLHPESPNE